MAKEMIAMLLAGGQGSRLYALTQKLAKPAVPFGGKYRIIDFPLSNCVNSGIDTVGILTQYQPLVLNEYIGNGQPWDLDRLHGGVHVLPPYQKASGSGTRVRPMRFTRTSHSLSGMTRSTSSSFPATRYASRITATSSGSTRKKGQSSAWPSWKCRGKRRRVSV